MNIKDVPMVSVIPKVLAETIAKLVRVPMILCIDGVARRGHRYTATPLKQVILGRARRPGGGSINEKMCSSILATKSECATPLAALDGVLG